MKGDVIFLCQFFYPENVSSATLPFDTAKHLADCGFEVGALCGYPKEYAVDGNVPTKETVSRIYIRRIKYIQLDRKSKLGRLINYFSFTLSAFLHIRTLKKYRAVIVYSNPPILPAVAILAKRLYKTKLVFVAYDVYPEIGYASASIKKGHLIDKVMKRINRSLYAGVDKVVSLTDEMKHFLLSNRDGISEENIVTIANWSHEKSIAKSKDAYTRFGYKKGQFIVSYFGNMGTCQDINTLIHAAKLMKDDDRVRFLIIGHGNKKEQVKKFISDNALLNTQLLDYLTGDDFEKAVSITSCFIVSLEKGLIGTCAPSKYYSCLQGGHPIIAVVEKGSYLAEEVENERIGCYVAIDDAISLKRQITRLCNNPDECEKMGERAKQLYLNRYNKSIAMKKYEDLFSEIIGVQSSK